MTVHNSKTLFGFDGIDKVAIITGATSERKQPRDWLRFAGIFIGTYQLLQAKTGN